MGIALLLIGLALVSSGIRNTQGQLASALQTDFTGSGSFFYYIAGLFAIGAIGYYSPLRGASRLFIALVVIVMLIDNNGFLTQLQSAIQNPTPSQAPPAPIASANSSSTSASAGSSPAAGSGSATSTLQSALSGANSFDPLNNPSGAIQTLGDIGSLLLGGL